LCGKKLRKEIGIRQDGNGYGGTDGKGKEGGEDGTMS